MYSLFGLKKNIETILILGSLDGNFPQSTQELKRKYKNYLKSIQPEITVSALPMETELIWDAEKSQKLIEFFSAPSALNDLNQEKIISRGIQIREPIIREQTIKALKKLQILDPQLEHLFQLIIEKIFFAESAKAGGGSSSTALGCIWLNPRHHWTEQDYLEFFIHELTHNLLFLDERREIHYPEYSELEKTENYAYSAILKRARPLDKVIHSLFVVYEVLAFRLKHFNPANKTFLHPDTENLFSGAHDTLKSLRTVKPQLLSPHLKKMILKLEKNILQLKRDCYENQDYVNR